MHCYFMRLYNYVIITTCYYARAAEQGGGAESSPPLFQICELRGLASHCVNLGTLACNTTHMYLDINADI